jgi:histone arginine demethylase JMJD6
MLEVTSIVEESSFTAIDTAKRNIAPHAKPEDWSTSAGNRSLPSIDVDIDVHSRSVTVDGRRFQDNVDRVSGALFEDDLYGDSLPDGPAVLTGLMDDWPAFSNPGVSWSVQDLASRSTAKVSLDGGPSFARSSMSTGRVTLNEYQQYCERNGAGDSAPLYVFDPDILKSTFLDGTHVTDSLSIPPCFSRDFMECINGSQYRPLPSAWLLVGVTGSGTPIHDHPLTVAWNALLVGCKLWCCLPPDVDETLLLLNLDFQENQEFQENQKDFDLSARDWFRQCGELVDTAKIIVQRPGEVVFLPAGWFHVVLNVETSTAISVSLARRQDLELSFPLLRESDEEFATFWWKRLQRQSQENSNFCLDKLSI